MVQMLPSALGRSSKENPVTADPAKEPTANQSKRAQWLAQELERHNELYYTQATPEISDREFDELMKELEALEEQFPSLKSTDSPTQRVGGRPLEEFVTVEHREPMLSMDNTYSIDELRAFHERLERQLPGEEMTFTAEPKIDGVSISLLYEEGVLVRGATRGDGRRGDDVTGNIRTIRTLPLRLKGEQVPRLLEVRGEVYFTKQDFAKINIARDEAGEVPFANPRNTAAGTLKQLDPKLVAERPLRIFLYALGDAEGVEVANQLEALTLLERLGLPVVAEREAFDDFAALIQHVEDWASKRHELDYEVDGMVIKVASFSQRRRLGSTSKAPRWQVAYKYAAEQAITQLEAIEIQVGKTGKLTPVAHLTPVQLSGTTVARASLHNDEEIKRKDIRVGDWVVVEKAGEIIPQVVSVSTERRTGNESEFSFPTHCPVCEAAVERDEGGIYIRCVNPDCPAQIRNILEFFAHRSAMDIEGVGPALIEQLYEQGLVRRLPDLYRLTTENLEQLERMGKKSAANAVAAIEKSKEQPLARVLTGLGIRHVGQRGAEVIAEHFGSVDDIISSDPEKLAEVEEVGPVMAQSIHDYFHKYGGKEIIAELRELGLTMKPERTRSRDTPQPLAGKTLVATGKLDHYSRDGIKDRIKAAGGRASSSVSKKTDYVVVGENAGSKADDAQRLGVPMISEAEFRKMVGDE